MIFKIFCFIILLSSFLISDSFTNEWLVIWGDWQLHNNFIQSCSFEIPLQPPGAINNFNAIIYKNKIKNPFDLKLNFKIEKLYENEKYGLCGLAFELKNGNNFYAVYVKVNNKNYYLNLIQASDENKKEKNAFNYKISTIKEIKITNFIQNDWNKIIVKRDKKQLNIKLNNLELLSLPDTNIITDQGRICLIANNVICSFESIDVSSEKKHTLLLGKGKMILKKLEIKMSVDKVQNLSPLK